MGSAAPSLSSPDVLCPSCTSRSPTLPDCSRRSGRSTSARSSRSYAISPADDEKRCSSRLFSARSLSSFINPSPNVTMLQDSLLNPRPRWLIDAFALLAAHRFLEVRQVAGALGLDGRVVTGVFEGLVGEGLLQTLTPTTLSLGHLRPTAFALTRAGVACVVAGVDDPPTRHVVRPLTSSFTLAHELLVNEFALVLQHLHADHTLRLLSWWTARDRIAEVTHLAVKGRVVRVPLVADALAIVEHRGLRTGLLIEIDMGTVSARTMRQKFAGYHAWWNDGGPARRFGLSATRVVTVAPAPRRMKRLRDLSIEAVDGRGSGLFWFLPHEAVDVAAPGRLLGAVARVGKANDEDLRPLFAS